MVSGGSDSKLCVWSDATREREKQRHDAQAEVAMKDSKIGVLVRDGKIESALSLALELNRPSQMRQILVDHALNAVGECLARCNEEDSVRNGDVDLQRWVLSLSSTLLE